MRYLKTSAIIFFLLVFLVVAAGCGRSDFPPKPVPSGNNEMENPMERDIEIEDTLKTINKAEAGSWLKNEAHGILGISKDDAGKLAKDLYVAGAKQVFITDIEELDETMIAAAMIVVLPNEKVERDRVFQVELDYSKKKRAKPTPDVGQKYLEFVFE